MARARSGSIFCWPWCELTFLWDFFFFLCVVVVGEDVVWADSGAATAHKQISSSALIMPLRIDCKIPPFVRGIPSFRKNRERWGSRCSLNNDASQMREHCVAKNATHRAARPDSLGFARDRLFTAQRTLVQDDNQTSALRNFPATDSGKVSSSFCDSQVYKTDLCSWERARKRIPRWPGLPQQTSDSARNGTS